MKENFVSHLSGFMLDYMFPHVNPTASKMNANMEINPKTFKQNRRNLFKKFI